MPPTTRDAGPRCPVVPDSDPRLAPKPSTGTERRRRAIQEVEGCVCRDRQHSYGDAEDNFEAIASLWTTLLGPKLVRPITRTDVASLMVAVKLARARTSPGNRDNWIDAAGYAVCAAGIQEVEAAAAVEALENPMSPTSSIAPGHNPHRLTLEQIGYKDGWRLLEPAEVRLRGDDADDIEGWVRGSWKGPFAGSNPDCTYRTRRPAGYFLDQ